MALQLYSSSQFGIALDDLWMKAANEARRCGTSAWTMKKAKSLVWCTCDRTSSQSKASIAMVELTHVDFAQN